LLIYAPLWGENSAEVNVKGPTLLAQGTPAKGTTHPIIYPP
jgi:hypothetical protein